MGASILVAVWRRSAVRGGCMGGGLRGGGFEPTMDVGAAPAYMLTTSCCVGEEVVSCLLIFMIF